MRHQTTTAHLKSCAMVGSYVRSRPYVMTVDNNCRLLATPQQPFLLQHDCQVAQGSSGAPLLALDNGTPIIVGMQVAIGRSNGSNTMLALSAPSIMANLSPR